LPVVTGQDEAAVDGAGPIDGACGDTTGVPGWLTAGVPVEPRDGDDSRVGGDGLIAEQAAKQKAARANPSCTHLLHRGAAIRSLGVILSGVNPSGCHSPTSASAKRDPMIRDEDDFLGSWRATVFLRRFVLLEPLAERAADETAPCRLFRRSERSTNLRPGVSLLTSL
jgi:hypothetical protein